MASSTSTCSLQSSILTFNGFRPSSSSSSDAYCRFSLLNFRENCAVKFGRNRLKQKKINKGGNICRAMVQQQTVQGPSAAYAKEMERLSAKESLLLAVSFTLLSHFSQSIDFAFLNLLSLSCFVIMLTI